MQFPKNNTHQYFAIILLACSVFFIVLVSVGKPNLADDAYIFLRIVRNIISGDGYVFNVGVPVEGGTSLLWVMILTGIAAAGVSLELTAKLLGMTMGVLTLILLWSHFRSEKNAVMTTLLLLLTLITNQGYRLSINKGMETGLYALLLLILLLVQLRESSSFVTGILGVLLFMTRPESIVTLAMLGGWMVWVIYSSSQKYFTLNKLLRIILIWSFGILVVTLWRWFTFGAVVPNSAMAKSPSMILFSDPHFLVIRVGSGVLYILGWLKQSWLIVFSALIGLVVLYRNNKYHSGLFVSLVVPSLVVVLISGGDWMANHRLLTPILPSLLLLSGIAVNRATDRFKESKFQWFEVGLAICLCFISLLMLPVEVKGTQPGTEFLNCYGEVGQVVAESLPANATIAPEGIGKIGYMLPEYAIFDFLGLVDPYIARNGTIPTPNFTYGKVDYQHMMDVQPEIFIFHTLNFFEPLGNLGYETKYDTYQINTQPCDFLWVGIRKDMVSKTKPILGASFSIEQFNLQ